ncbi:MAG: PrgI family protein [Patescibacteria group bacterium]|nr:PrgI family protein [Patescibacteria group bacterium]
MPEKFVVPQFIDVEDKIFGPITTRQFVILLVDGLFVFIAFKLLEKILFIPAAILLLGAGGLLAFIKVNGMPFHFFLLNIIQTMKRPSLRVWDKTPSNTELRAYISKPEVKAAPVPPKKEPLTTSRLSELSLIVNTGGLYKPEEYEH